MSQLQAARRDDREHLEEHAGVEMPGVWESLARNFAGSAEAVGHSIGAIRLQQERPCISDPVARWRQRHSQRRRRRLTRERR